MQKLWGNGEYPYIAIDPSYTLARVVAPEKVLSMDQIEVCMQTNDLCKIELLEIELW